MIAFRNALWQLLDAPRFEAGVVDTVMRGGDTDANEAICGPLADSIFCQPTPVKKRIWVDLGSKHLPGVEAGLAALARYSTLAGSANPVFAMEGKEWKRFRMVYDPMELPFEDPKACALEIRTYSPELFAENGVVERFSVYLSLQDTEDERVESALEEMMEQRALRSHACSQASFPDWKLSSTGKSFSDGYYFRDAGCRVSTVRRRP